VPGERIITRARALLASEQPAAPAHHAIDRLRCTRALVAYDCTDKPPTLATCQECRVYVPTRQRAFSNRYLWLLFGDEATQRRGMNTTKPFPKTCVRLGVMVDSLCLFHGHLAIA
jgi:hypothetical protein